MVPAALVAVVAASTAGCYVYRPVETPSPGSTVRVLMPVVSAVSGRNVADRFESVEGTLVSNGETIVLAVQTRREFGAYREVIQHDTVSFVTDQLAAVDVREFSRGKSIGLGVGIAAGLTGLAMAAFGTFGSPGDPGGGDPPEPQPAIVVNRSIVSWIWGLIGS
jgi:hypothetical protein